MSGKHADAEDWYVLLLARLELVVGFAQRNGGENEQLQTIRAGVSGKIGQRQDNDLPRRLGSGYRGEVW